MIGVFGLNNQFILNEMAYHKFIPQIWWNKLISHTSTNYYFLRFFLLVAG
jgi:hypothetical protein